MAAVESAPAGKAPPELAQHLAACARCQARLLAAATGRAGRSEPAAGGGMDASARLQRTIVFIVAALVLAVAALALVGLLRPGA
jgi:hypothetical protein